MKRSGSRWTIGVLSATTLACGVLPSRATETENFNFRLLPAPQNIKVDGKFEDWNLAGGVFATSDAEKLRDQYAVWLHGSYDAENVYILARWNDLSPLNNPSDTKLEFGWAGDCVQVRFITNYLKPNQQISVANCWKGRDGRDVVELDTPGFTKNSPKGDDIKGQGAQQVFSVNADGKGYVQEIAIPWKFLTAAGAPKAGEDVVMTFEPNFTTGPGNRWSTKDVFRPGVTLDRVFTFQNKSIWGVATLLADDKIAPSPVRLSDGRQFPVSMQNGIPVVDWTGLEKSPTIRGAVPIKFSMPAKGHVSLVIKNSKGEIVRHLLKNAPYSAGEQTVMWDGLAEPWWRFPSQAVPAGEYSWSAIYHAGIGLKWRGAAANASPVPWDNGAGTNWGGDMGHPEAAAAEGDYVLLGWNAAEAGKAAVLTDLNGKVLWGHKRGGFGGAPFVGLDGGVAYIFDHTTLYRLGAAKSNVVPFDNGAGEMSFAALIGEPNTFWMPQGFDVKNGRMYLSSSEVGIRVDEIADWRAFFTKISAAPGDRVWKKLAPDVQTRVSAWLQTTSDANELRAMNNQGDARASAVDALNSLLSAPLLVNGKPGKLTGGALGAANRAAFEKAYGIATRNSSFVAVVGAQSGKLIRKIALPGAAKLAANAKGAYVLVDRSTVVWVDGASGATKTVVKNLQNAHAVALDASGNIYVGVRDPLNQVLVYSPKGKLLRTIGKKGGRAETGVWQPEALRQISALTVDRAGKLWVGEELQNPKRFSSWNAQTGKLIKEYFGATRYGASGGAIHPNDPNVMVGEAAEWKLDPKTGMASCVGVIDTLYHAFSLFSKTTNGRDYLAATVPSYIPDGLSSAQGIKIYERIAPGNYKLRSTIYGRQDRPGTHDHQGHTEFWADANDDQKVQPAEVQIVPQLLRPGGYYLWSMHMNAQLTFFGGAFNGDTKPGLMVKVGGYSPCGAPIYDVAGARALPGARGGLGSPDDRFLLAGGGEGGNFDLYDLNDGTQKWSYTNGWSGVHGSHTAPPPETGLIRGAFGSIGTARLPEPIGDIWAINSNVGEWHLLTREGFYLSRLFEADPMKVKFPDSAAPGTDVTEIPSGQGGEDFGGSMVQGKDGKVYIQAGKTALWNMEVTGLETLKAIPGGKLALSDADVRIAQNFRETLLQEVAAPRSLDIKKATPTFTGNLAVDFAGATIVDFQKGEDAKVRSTLAYDDANLYLGWDVTDATPWTNAAKAPEDLYLSGDTVDFQLGTDAAADKKRNDAILGDLRISIGNFAGKDTAVIYRKVSTTKKPRIFSSGIVREYPMDYVSTIPEAKITVTKRDNGYVVQAAIPLGVLGVQPAAGVSLRGDMGATYGDPAGTRTRLRNYWSNQETGIVDDAVYELMMKPGNWGELIWK